METKPLLRQQLAAINIVDRTPAPEQSSAPSKNYAKFGVDRSLIQWMLSLSPTERLLVIQQ